MAAIVTTAQPGRSGDADIVAEDDCSPVRWQPLMNVNTMEEWKIEGDLDT
jgi:hypothetical protein